MSFSKVDKTTGELYPISGGILYADAPIGSIIPFGGSTIPSGFLLCDGSEVLKTTYSELYSIIGDSFGTASENTKFVLPDLRGEFLRGAGTNSHSGQGNGRSVGQHQNATAIPNVYKATGGGQVLAASGVAALFQNVDGIVAETSGSGYATIIMSESTSTDIPSHYMTRPTNTSVNYIIKAANTSLPLEFEDALDECVKKADVQSSAISGNNNPISSGGAYIEFDKKADKATTLSGYNISNAYTKDEVDNKISELVTSMTWKPAVATYADIATTYPNPQEGWTVVTTDTNIAWRYTNGAWIKISANTIPVVTSEVNGLMTSTMLSKLNGIAAGAEVNVQPNWTQTNTSADDYIKNKPTIPTKTSDLTNDSGFESPVVLTKNLAAGATSLTFTDASIGNNSRIIIYTKPYSQGVVTGATQSGTSVTVTCAAQSSAYDVSIEIRN